MKVYKLKKKYKGLKKGTEFYLIAESEFIGVKDFVLRTKDLSIRISVGEKELHSHFTLMSYEERVNLE
ncbi:hypothetical protein KDJ21_009085 [Metabacillus litoralis]|uniref:hypothetical protein n=1 Tax=Metabacillus TaxID=2675233 RepID=UPI000EF62365|nr:hypothetical protein [Metabacillus litoralis]MCM3165143.1 hypothetical protein [Metabacillus litoralis]MCM3413717.1 hypothetical protein [Metabacillus litoralis]UHA61775.1 hypothetical protein KDJ21_009085 [Metabacillus litoralis]